MTQKISQLAQTNIHLCNEKTKYENQKNRALKFEKLYKEEKQKRIDLEIKIKELKQDKETDKHTIEEYKRMIFYKKSKSYNTESEHKSIFNEAKNKKRSKESEILRPEYERLRRSITSQKGVHFDETGWLVQQEEGGNYAWCMTGTETEDVLFDIGISRGGGAIKILAQNTKENEAERKEKKQEEKIIEFVGISDNYGGYTNKFDKITILHKNDPKKLITYKTTLAKYREKYFVCILIPGIPADNNKAERSLRHLVLKKIDTYYEKHGKCSPYIANCFN